MSKLDLSTIIIVALCVLALGFLIWKTIGINNEKKANANTTQVIDPQDDGTEDYEFDDEGEIVADDATNQSNGSSGQGVSDEGTDSQIDAADTGTANGSDATDDDDKNSEGSGSTTGASTSTSTGGSTTATRPAPTFYDDDSRGQYLVLAGAFRVKDNGINEARRIRRMGYPDAEMTLMDRGTYATVLVDRFQSMSDAKELVQDLEAKGVESYVHRKR